MTASTGMRRQKKSKNNLLTAYRRHKAGTQMSGISGKRDLSYDSPLCYNTEVAKLNTYVDSGDGAVRDGTGRCEPDRQQSFLRRMQVSLEE